MSTNPTHDDYERWHLKVAYLLVEIEEAHGDNAAGCYPHPTEMTLRLALDALRDAAKRPAAGLDVAPPKEPTSAT
jgi:hypothetical protein